VPLPLGGTSNHFRAAVLRAIGAWDPFNVTEDADVGLRLAQFGYRVSMLDSTTFEEAPTRIGAWIRQRSRWLKGYMQTWLVHCRNPQGLIGKVGVGGFASFQLFIGGSVLLALVNPLLWTIFALSCVLPLPIFGGFHGDLVSYASAAGAIGSNGLLTFLAISGPIRRGRAELAPYGLTVTLYWLLISVAGYRALWQLLTKPFHWDKTTHGLSTLGRGATVA
jgi:cellulose synthase/poly-beta-1,6-N-acetylglucosamine synthase-like glycosyltransferase